MTVLFYLLAEGRPWGEKSHALHLSQPVDYISYVWENFTDQVLEGFKLLVVGVKHIMVVMHPDSHWTCASISLSVTVDSDCSICEENYI